MTEDVDAIVEAVEEDAVGARRADVDLLDHLQRLRVEHRDRAAAREPMARLRIDRDAVAAGVGDFAHRRERVEVEDRDPARRRGDGRRRVGRGGSTLTAAATYRFDITVSDPDTTNPKDKITKIDIVTDGGKVVSDFTPTPDYTVHWNTGVSFPGKKYFFVRVWTAGGGDAPGADPANPVAWLAPVWTGQ